MGSSQARYLCMLKNMHKEICMYEKTTEQNDWNKIFNRFCHEGFGFLTTTLSTLGKSIIMSFQTDRFSCPMSFKRQKGTELPMIYNGSFRRIYEADGSIKDEPDIESVRLLIQLCFMFYKLELPYTEQKKAKAFLKWEESEDACKSVFFLENDPTICAAREIITKLYADLDVKAIKPHASGGKLATDEIGVQKYIATRKYLSLHRVFPYYEYFIPPGSIPKGMLGGSRYFLDMYKSLVTCRSGISKMAFVPKNVDGPRIINEEPAEYMFIQQGLKDIIVPMLERKTGNQINFFDQSYNQQKAHEGSINGFYSTYDFQSCSDRISAQLVDVLFRGVPKVRDALFAARSEFVDTPHGIRRLYKYAPMGSALCFPVMASIIYAVAKSISPLPVLVYGDDLIVEDDSSYKNLPTVFEGLGLKVNVNKSFTRGSFRESCGMDAFKGHVVTPVRIKKDIACTIAKPESFAALVESSNQLYKAGYWHLAGCLREIISQDVCVPVPTSSVHENIRGLHFCFATDAISPTFIKVKHGIPYYYRHYLDLHIPKLKTSLDGDFGYFMGLLRCGAASDSSASEIVIRDTSKKAELKFGVCTLVNTKERYFCAA